MALWFACSAVLWLGYQSGSPALLWGALLVLLPAYAPRHLWSRRFIKQIIEIRNGRSQVQRAHLKRFQTWMAGERSTTETPRGRLPPTTSSQPPTPKLKDILVGALKVARRPRTDLMG